MESEKKIVLETTSKEYFSSANDEFLKRRYNSAVVLYFKTLVALSDLFILQKTGNTPSSHNDRFRMSKEKFPLIYHMLDKDFPFYQDSYKILMSKELAEVIKDDAKKIAEETKIKLE